MTAWRSWTWLLLCGMCALGCASRVVHHGAPGDDGAAADVDAGEGALDASGALGGEGGGEGERDAGGGPVACGVDADGEPCDDYDICTPVSRCQGDVCVGNAGFDGCTVADALAEYGETQGADDWRYGYWNQTQDADGSYDAAEEFSEMEFCSESRMWMPPGRCDTREGDAGYRWTRVLDWALLHPETRPDTELPIRRWVSDVSGPARIVATHWVGGVHGDGTRALLLVDGVEIWRNDAEPGDKVGTTEEFPVMLHVGTRIDQIVHPIGSSADDMTHFSIVVEGP